MTLFGWIYLTLMIIGSITVINEIDKPRKPRTRGEVSYMLLFSGLTFWALYVWGIH